MKRVTPTVKPDALDSEGEPLPRIPARADQPRDIGVVGHRQLGGTLAGLSLPRQVLVLSIWPLLEQIMNFLIGTTDLALAGHLNPPAQAVWATDALGVAIWVNWMMSMIHSAVGVGSVALISRAIGRRHRGLANAALGQSLVLAALGGVLVGGLICTGAGPIGAIAGLHAEGLALCKTYLRIVAAAAPVTALLLVANAAMRGAGDTRSPFKVMVVAYACNVMLSLAFVYGPTPLGGHGLAGIACGTALAWLIGAMMALTMLWRGHGPIRVHLGRLRPHWHTMRRIIRVAAPNVFESVGALWLSNFLVLMIVGRLADQAVLGAHLIVIRIEALSFLPGASMAIAAATLTGQYLGLGDPQRAQRAVLWCWAFATIIMGPVGLVFVAVPRALVWIMTNAQPLIELAPTPLRICGPVQIFLGTHMVLAAAFRGAGDTRSALWLTALSTLGVRLPAVYVAAVILDLGLEGVWYAMSAEIVVRGCIFTIYFLRGRWATVHV